ncbi:MAG: hypothetical protein IJ509_01275 [Bacilli bacterium]|nr:hypothetical protein [Bacilli bacterium]
MKKGLKLLTCGVICMSTFAWKVNAEEVSSYDKLVSCVAKSGNTCTLANDIEFSETLNITNGVDVTIDLNGNDITGATAVDPLFYINNGSLDVTGKGTITAAKDVFSLLGNNVTGGAAIKAELKIGSDVDVTSNTANCIFIKGKGAKADVYGNLTSKGSYAAIQGNGTVDTKTDNGNTTINIYDGASVINENDHAIYHPQTGTLTVNGGTITGATGIEMRAGNLVVKGGTITATAKEFSVEANGNGTTTVGAGIAIAQHTTAKDINVSVSAGTVKGIYALNESDPNKVLGETNNNTISITGGTFEGAIDSENETGFITNGNFNTDVTKFLAANGNTSLKETEDGYKAETVYEVTKGEDQKITTKEGTEVTFTIDADYNLFDKLYINGTEVDKKYYTIKSGSTIITLSSDYLATLSSGSHKITATFTDGGTATTDLTLVSNDTAPTSNTPQNPKTSDNILTYIMASIISILGLVTTAVGISKKQKNN